MTDERKRERLTVSLAKDTKLYLAEHAQAETGGNISALIDRLVHERRLTESVRQHADHYQGTPFWDDLESELAQTGAV